MRRTIAAAAGTVMAVTSSMALLVPTGAGAQAPAPPPTRIEGLCTRLPELMGAVDAARLGDTTRLETVGATLATQRAAMTTAMTELAAAVVAHLGALDTGANTSATASVLKGKQARYVDTVVSWSRTRREAFDIEQMLVFRDLQDTLLDTVNASACS